MNESKMKNALASLRLEGFEFSEEQIQFVSDLADRIDRKEISWDEAIEIIIERHR